MTDECRIYPARLVGLRLSLARISQSDDQLAPGSGISVAGSGFTAVGGSAIDRSTAREQARDIAVRLLGYLMPRRLAAIVRADQAGRRLVGTAGSAILAEAGSTTRPGGVTLAIMRV
jgi:hypothetical protein